MLKKLLFIVTSILIISCSNLKHTNQQLAIGNYDSAINNALDYLTKKRYGKKATNYHKILFESYTKAVEKDERTLKYLNNDPNPEGLERVFETYLQLEKRQNKIRPLLPIDGYRFKMQDYTMVTIDTRDKLSEHLYQKAGHKLKSDNKQFVREAHNDFKYINNINPNYKNVINLIEQSHQKGTDFVFVQLKNNTQYILPKKLKDDILNIQQYKLNNYWIVHHVNKISNIKYDYNLILSFNNIQLSPERINQVHLVKKKKIKDGKKYVLDESGNVKKDEKGNDIKVDAYKTVICTLHQFTQFKECIITAKSTVVDNYTKQVISSTPYRSNYIFEHIYATQSGDKRALTKQYLDMLLIRPITFPSNEQMIFDATNDIKNQLRKQLTGLKF